MITPPWTFPAMFASVTSIIWVRVTSESETVRAPDEDTRASYAGRSAGVARTPIASERCASGPER